MESHIRRFGVQKICNALLPFCIDFQNLLICRSDNKNKLMFFFEGFPCVLPRETESVLVGSAILGACASGDFTSIQVGTLVGT